jgi:hypothetical protein
VMLDSENNHVLSWMRKVAGAPTVVVAANFTAEPQTVNLVIPAASGQAKTLLKTPGTTDPASFAKIELGLFGGLHRRIEITTASVQTDAETWDSRSKYCLWRSTSAVLII